MLRLQLLGDFTVLRHGAPIPLPQSRKTRALFAYLAVTGRSHQRERLCDIFWDGPNDPKAELRWSLSKIRQMLGDEASPSIDADRHSVRLPPGRIESDVAEVQSLAAADLSVAELGRLERAAELFHGPFLADLPLPRCPEYELWRAALANDCALLHVRILRTLIERLNKQPERALHYAQSLKALLTDDQDIGNQIENLLRTAQAGVVGSTMSPVSREATTPETASTDYAPSMSALAAIAGVRTYATVYAAELIPPPLHFEGVDPEIAEQELALLRQQIGKVVERHGGVIVSEVMTEITAVFGAPGSLEDHAARACAAALDAQATLRSLTDGAIELRAGVDSGETFTKVIPNRTRPETAGPPLRGARELMRSLRRPMSVATERVCRLTGARIQFRLVAESDLAALPGETTAHQIEREDHALSRWGQRARQGLSKFVGREAESAILQRAAEGSKFGHGQAVGVQGNPGLGKSRLTHEFLDRAVEAGFMVLESAPVELEALVPYRTLKKLLWSWLGLAEAADAKIMAAELAKRVSGPNTPANWTDPLHYILDLPVGGGWTKLDPYEQAANIRAAIRQLIEHESRLRPHVILLEDLHWLDPESESVLAALLEHIAHLPILILVTYRPEYTNRDILGRITQITLDSLSVTETRSLLDHLLGVDESLDSVKQLILDRADGVPLFLEELVQQLIAGGTLTGPQGHYACIEPPDSLIVPSSLRTAISARIDRLDPTARSILQIASVIGRDVDESLLARVSEISISELSAPTKLLRSGNFIYEQQSFPSVVYAFNHALIYDVAYASLLLETRRLLHEKVLRALEQDSSRPEEDVEALAEHALRAKAWDAALRYCVRAADRSVERSAYAGAVRFLEGAVEALDNLPRTPERLALAVDVRTRLRPAYEATGQFLPALKRLEEAQDIAAALGDDRLKMKVLLHHSYLNSTHGRAEPAIHLAKQVAAIAQSLGEERYAAEADLAYAQGLAQRYEVAAMLPLLEPHRDAFATRWHSDRFGLLGTRAVFFFGYLSFAYAFLGRFEEADAAGQEAVLTARETGRPIDKCAALYYASYARLLSRPDTGLIDELKQGARDCRDALRSPFYPCLLARLAQAQMAAGSLEECFETIARLDEAAGRIKMPHCRAQAQALGAIAGAKQRGNSAQKALVSALFAVRSLPDPWMEILILKAQAELGGENAEQLARAALSVAETSGLSVEIAHCRALLTEMQKARAGSIENRD